MSLSVDLIGSSASQGTVGSHMAVPPQEAGQADVCFPTIAVGMQVDLLILERPPESLDQDVVVAALPAGPADSDSLLLQPADELGRRELAALIGMEDLWLSPTGEGHLQGIQAELRVKAVGEPPTEDVP